MAGPAATSEVEEHAAIDAGLLQAGGLRFAITRPWTASPPDWDEARVREPLAGLRVPASGGWIARD